MIMKKFALFFVLVAAFMLGLSFASCDKLDSDDKTSGDDQAFFPIEYDDKTVAAWYSLTQKEDNKTRTEAVFLFTDSTLVVTKNKVKDGRNPERSISAEGKYVLSEGSDYTNGSATVILSDTIFEVTITDGKLYAMGEILTKQDNSKLPTPKRPTDNNGNGGNNQGGNNQGDGNDLDPFFPKAYEGKNLSVWYSCSATEEAQGYEFKRTSSIYFFEDNTYVATINMSTSSLQHGQHNSCMIIAEGIYEIVEGNFTTGKISITYDKNTSMTVEVQDGQMKIKDTETTDVVIYYKQDNTKVPQPSEPTGNNQGGDNGGGNGNGDGGGTQAFFPIEYANKNVAAWYSYSISNEAGTTVEAVFLFENDTLVVTQVYVPSQEAGGSMEQEILLEGTFSLTGTYDNGSAQIYNTDGDLIFNVSIVDSKLSAMGQTFIKQDNSNVPTPTQSTNMDGDGDGDGSKG